MPILDEKKKIIIEPELAENQQFLEMGLNKEGDALSFLGRHIRLSLSVAQYHQEQGLSHMMPTVKKFR